MNAPFSHVAKDTNTKHGSTTSLLTNSPSSDSNDEKDVNRKSSKFTSSFSIDSILGKKSEEDSKRSPTSLVPNCNGVPHGYFNWSPMKCGQNSCDAFSRTSSSVSSPNSRDAGSNSDRSLAIKPLYFHPYLYHNLWRSKT